MPDFKIPGYHGRILEVELSSGTARVKPLDPGLALDYLGGRGLATRILYDTIEPACDPLGPENAVVKLGFNDVHVLWSSPTSTVRGVDSRLFKGFPEKSALHFAVCRGCSKPFRQAEPESIEQSSLRFVGTNHAAETDFASRMVGQG